ncbi:MAG: hypothetical protein HN644_01185 [Rhodospirillales bacterium]|jgi:hypothetical protein|nr:hypothetical protein [Rhodospirillales bacterium]MBT4040936.1 hypothetical protein [Rhodospirillales bacterium]MBT4625795.1 hypothetical protein [Rhodospirillales bacterium]MBT5351510.1 hypothetical protein [Rhodospirillales bacterium]MBT5520031.1 hypothetical protein [Rhodospirillales bacterium]
MKLNVKDIPPPLSDRTLKHGRHVMTVAGIILVLAWIPGWDLLTLDPFGYKIDVTMALLIWALLSGILVYFTFHLYTGVQAQLPAWLKHFAVHLEKFENGDRTPIPDAIGHMARRALWSGKSLPLLTATIALIVAISEILPLIVSAG